MNREELSELFDVDFERLKKDKQTITLELYKADAWCLMRQVQIASQMPGNGGVAVDVAKEIATRLINVLATTPSLKEVAERGWKAW